MEDLARWLQRAAQRDEQAFRALYRTFRPAVVRLVAAFGALEADEVDDVVQESFVRAFRHVASLRNAAAFEPWLLSIARNRALTLAERKALRTRTESAALLEAAAASELYPEFIQREAAVEVVRQLIAELPEGSEKTTASLFYVDGVLSARQIAEKLGVGKSAVTMRLERFRARVKKELLRRLTAARAV
jgi:RNA polymerase sigma-70 factor (ECF subfamily)